MTRPQSLPSNTTKISTGHGSMFVTVGSMDDKPVEVLVSIGKSGSCDRAWAEALTRAICLCLQYKVPIEELVYQLRGIQCDAGGDDYPKSPADGIAKILSEYIS